MDYLSEGWEEHGFFVYEVLVPKISVKSHYSPVVDGDQYGTGVSFQEGDLVAIDLVRPCRQDNQVGPFLRLADGAGWLLEHNVHSHRVMQRVPVEKALWAFYIDNIPHGQALLRHPVDRLQLMISPLATYPPMRLIYCDRKVASNKTGQSFYRVQGTKGWIVDKLPAGRSSNDSAAVPMLLPESQIQTGCFAFLCKRHVPVKTVSREDGEIASCTVCVLKRGDIFVADAIRNGNTDHMLDASESSAETNIDCAVPTKTKKAKHDGPCLRLSDGSGWVFRSKIKDKYLEEIPIQLGVWVFRNASDAVLRVYRQPMDRVDMMLKESNYSPGSEIVCDARLLADELVTFYRVKGSHGFICHHRNGERLLQLVKAKSSNRGQPDEQNWSNSKQQGTSWSPDFVRGVASLVEGAKEAQHNEDEKMLVYTTKSSCENDMAATKYQINIYYTVRVVGVSAPESELGYTQTFRRECGPMDLADIMRHPSAVLLNNNNNNDTQAETTTATLQAEEASNIQHGLEELSGQEEEQILRQELIDCYSQSETLKQKQLAILKILRTCDDRRAALDRDYAMRQARRVEEQQHEELQQRISGRDEQSQLVEKHEETETPASTPRSPQSVVSEMQKIDLSESNDEEEHWELEQVIECICEECGARLKDARSRQRHWKSVHGFKCDTCGVSYPSLLELADHQDEWNHGE